MDPLADAYGQEMFNPYVAMGNAPESMIDPNGERFVIGPQQQTFVLSEAQKLTNDKLAINSQTGEIYIKQVASGKLSKSSGTQLIRDLISKNSTVTVEYSPNAVGSGTQYKNEKGAENDGGTDVTIIFSKNNGAAQYKVKGVTKSLQQKSYLVLGGELIHALVAMDGHKDKTGNGSHTYTNIYGEKQEETRDKDELATHGIGTWHYNPSMYRKKYPTENDLRRENNEPVRVAYEDDLEYKYRPENKFKKIKP